MLLILIFYMQSLYVSTQAQIPVIHSPPEVNVVENTEVSLTCSYASDTNPIYLTWYRNGTSLLPVDFSSQPCSLFYVDDTAAFNRSQRYRITCNQTQSTYTTTLTIPAENVTQYEHKSSWTCKARLSFSNAVILNVMWISPTITGPPNAEVLENTRVSLTCTFISVTNTLALIWTRNDNGLIYARFDTKLCYVGITPSALSVGQRYETSCDHTGSTYTTTLTIPSENFTEFEHKSVWKCFKFGENTGSNTVLLNVIVPVKWVQLTAPADIFLTPDNYTFLTCKTSVSRPSASVQWYINGSLVTSPRYNIVSNFSGNSTDGSRVVTISTIQIPWENGGWNQTIYCAAVNVNTVKSIATTIIHVSPGIPKISPATNQSVFYEGDSMSFYCFQSGGNPPPLIQWGGTCVNSSGIVTTSKTLIVYFNRTMNHEPCYCKTLTYDRVNAKSLVIMTVILHPNATSSGQANQYQSTTFCEGVATGAGSCFALFCVVVILWQLTKRTKCNHKSIKSAASDIERSPYEDIKDSKENLHQYMELQQTQKSENTYDNTNI